MFSTMMVEQNLNPRSANRDDEAIGKQALCFSPDNKIINAFYVQLHRYLSKKKNLNLICTDNILVIGKENKMVKLVPRVIRRN